MLRLLALLAAIVSAPQLASPRVATVGAPYTLVVVAPSRPVVSVALGTTVRKVVLGPAGRGRWRGTVRFPRAGAWSITATVAGKRHALGRVTARAAVRIEQAAKLAAAPDGTLLVADGGAGRVVRLDPRSGATTVVTAGLDRLVAVCAAADGAIYAVADEKLWRVDHGRRVLVWVSQDEGPTDCAATADGVVVSRYGDHVDRIAGGATVLARGFDRPHGVGVGADGAVYVADTYAGAVRRLTGSGTTLVASGLGRPMDVAAAPDGSLLVADLAGHRVVRLRDGAVTVVAAGLGDVLGVAVAGGSVYVAAQGDVRKIA